MTGGLLLDWALLAVSLFNALLLLWLGLTVLLNAERHHKGIWLSSGGLLTGAAFFVIHSAILGHGLTDTSVSLDFWWRLGWIPAILLPFLWYLVILWYAGHYRSSGRMPVRRLRRRHRSWFWLTIVGGSLLACLLAFANPLPSLSGLAERELSPSPTIAGIPVLILAYSLYATLCIALSVDALRHPEAPRRLMGELAREQARRWLTATAILLLVVSLMVGWAMVWIVTNTTRGILNEPLIRFVGLFDLGIAGLISVSILLLGQAVVSYEVFTGKTLPRRGLAVYWRRSVILAAGFSVLASGSATIGLSQIYVILLSTILMMSFFALLGWRSYVERQRLIENLRPFVGRRTMDSPVASSALQKDHESDSLFQALCSNLLNCRQACLFPWGPLAILAGPASFYPSDKLFSPPDLDQLAARLQASKEIGLMLDPERTNGLVFALPLWRQEGLSGILLLGQKRTGIPYTQEEIEIAQATGEQLLDGRASSEMMRRLISFQRRHLTAGQVIDQRVRRVIHDEMLPLIHATMLEISGEPQSQDRVDTAIDQLKEIHGQLSGLLQSIPTASICEIRRVGLIGAIKGTLSEELEGAFDRVNWEIGPGVEVVAGRLPPLIAEVLYSAAREGIRNSARHGRGNGVSSCLSLKISIRADENDRLQIVIEDNGVGIQDNLSRAISSKKAGELSTRSEKGRCEKSAEKGRAVDVPIRPGSGQGLALYSTLMAVIGGSLSVSSQPGEYTRMVMELPGEGWER